MESRRRQLFSCTMPFQATRSSMNIHASACAPHAFFACVFPLRVNGRAESSTLRCRWNSPPVRQAPISSPRNSRTLRQQAAAALPSHPQLHLKQPAAASSAPSRMRGGRHSPASHAAVHKGRLSIYRIFPRSLKLKTFETLFGDYPNPRIISFLNLCYSHIRTFSGYRKSYPQTRGHEVSGFPIVQIRERNET